MKDSNHDFSVINVFMSLCKTTCEIMGDFFVDKCSAAEGSLTLSFSYHKALRELQLLSVI